MTVFTFKNHNIAFLISEGDGHYSRENGKLPTGAGVVEPGTVLKDDTFSLVTTGDVHSNTVLDNLASIAGLITGETYSVAGTAIPTDTTFVANGTDAVTLSQASTGTHAGEAITITRSGGVTPWLASPDAALGVLMYKTDATLADVEAAYIARNAEVNGNMLIYPAGGSNDADVRAALKAIGIIVRD